MQLIYEEEVDRTLDHAREDGSSYYDYFTLKVRLFKDEISSRRLYVPVYVLVEDTESYVGDPDDDPNTRDGVGKLSRQVRTYTTGPDSRNIRRAIAIIDNFKEPK